MFFIELALWLFLPILLGLGAGLPAQLKKASRGLLYPAMNDQMGRLQFLTKIALLSLPVIFLVSVLLGAWFHEWRWATLGMFAVAGAAFGAAGCGQRIEQLVKQLQMIKHERMEMEHHE